MSCQFKNECPSYSGWCERPKDDFSRCIPFIINAVKGLRQETAVLREQINEKDTVIRRLQNRLQISPYGDDKIDELQEANDNLRFRTGLAERTLARVVEERDAAREHICQQCREFDVQCNCVECEYNPLSEEDGRDDD